ncbi:hypothetical protein A9Q74_03910 [Colwellia sp. 39_35_sub15_T18]|nr:hypothetical protein A9Q74_03910 [Colwellia sp. 39_35_sub15_T18]
MTPKYLLIFFSLLYLLSFNSQAKQCSVNLNYGVIIDPSHIRIIDHGKTIMQINGVAQLFIEGREIPLKNEQQHLVAEFANGIRKQIPEIVSIAIEGVDVGLKAVNKVIGGLTGENSASQQKIQTNFDELKWRIRTRFNQSANNYFIAPQDFDDFDDIFTGEFEQEIEEIISDSIGTILLAVGEAMINNADNENARNEEQRISTFDERMENMGKDLELEITASAKVLAKKAEQFCIQMTGLDKTESKMHQAIEQLKEFNLIEIN